MDSVEDQSIVKAKLTSEELRQRREQLGLSKRKLASKAGVAIDTLIYYEAGKRKPHQRTIDKILSVLDKMEAQSEIQSDGIDIPVEIGEVPITADKPAERDLEMEEEIAFEETDDDDFEYDTDDDDYDYETDDDEIIEVKPSFFDGQPAVLTYRQEQFLHLAVLFDEISEIFEKLSYDPIDSENLEDADAYEDDDEDEEDEEPIPSVEDYLRERHIAILPTEESEDLVEEGVFLTIAKVMAKKYDTIKIWLDMIKRNQGKRAVVRMDLSKCSQQQVADITQISNMTYECGLIPSFNYLKAPRYQLDITLPNLPAAINFFTGGWFELYLYATFQSVGDSLGIQVDIVRNVKILLHNGNEAELDMLGSCPQGLFWVEAKTGLDFNHLLVKYQKLRKLFGIPKNRALLLCSEFGENDPARARASLAGMTPVGIDDLETKIMEILCNPSPDDPIQDGQ